MGHFLAVSAFRDQSVQSLAGAISAYANRFDCVCEPLTDGSPDDSRDALVYSPTRGWTVVLWPSYFNIHDFELCRAVSSELSALVSTIHVYDGDYWAHALIESGDVRDIFASMPHYFAETPEDADRLAQKWRGNPRIVAEVVGIAADLIAPYFVHLPVDGTPLDRKGLPDDNFALDDIWVFTDLW